MKGIPLTQGQVALVDNEDYDWLMQWKWCAHKIHGVFYATRNEGRTTVRMHRQILDAAKGIQVDHIDGDGLNNQRTNLRLASHAENQRNRRKIQGHSKYKGVYKNGKVWSSSITVNGSSRYLGGFLTEIDAARAYDLAAITYHGSFAATNSSLGLL